MTFAGYSEWHTTTAAINYCTRAPKDWPQHHFRYIQLYIDSERLIDPIFDGRYFVNLGQEFGRTPYHLHITQSGTANYAPTDYEPTFIWSDNMQNLMMQNNKEQMSFVTDSSSHFMFPLDSAKLHQIFTFIPPIDIQALLIKNLVPGFYMPCGKIYFHTANGSAEVYFTLTRNPLIVYTAVLLLITAAMFAVFITLFVERGPLPQALVIFFCRMVNSSAVWPYC